MKSLYKVLGITLLTLMTSCYAPRKMNFSNDSEFSSLKSTDRMRLSNYGTRMDTTYLNDAFDLFKGEKHVLSIEIQSGRDEVLIYANDGTKKKIRTNIGNNLTDINLKKIIRLYNRHK